jgi:hypothetical protein
LQGGVNICDKRLVIPLHILAVLAVIGGLYRTVLGTQSLDVLSTYLLWAILFEMGALNANLSEK